MQKSDFLNQILSIVKAAYIEEPDSFATSFSEKCSKMESVTRPLWGVVFLSEHDAEGIDFKYINDRLLDGVNPESPDYWGKIEDYSHHACECIPISLYLLNQRRRTWDTFNENEKANLYNWLIEIINVKIPNNNWTFFRIVTVAVLSKLGFSLDIEKTLDTDFSTIESLYLGNGWYSDGRGKQRDYYIAFAFHYYSLLYTLINEDDIERRQIYRKRACEFADQYIHFFSADGSTVPFGRSLIYRFAQVSFWCAVVACDLPVSYSIQQIKGIIDRNLIWWSKQQIYRQDGKLNLGYTYPDCNFLEAYNGSSSVYWCLKISILLLTDESFWRKESEKFPTLDLKSDEKEGLLRIIHSKDYLTTILYMNGQESQNRITGYASKYGKFVYSNIFGFCCGRSDNSLMDGSYDNSLAITIDNDIFYTREKIIYSEFNEDYLLSIWSPVKGILVYSYVITSFPWHIRIHQIKSAKFYRAYDGGFSLESIKTDSISNTGVSIASETGLESYSENIFGSGKVILQNNYPNSNIYFPRSTTPYISFVGAPGVRTLIDVFSASHGVQDYIDSFQIKGKIFKVMTRNGNEITVKCKYKIRNHNDTRVYDFYHKMIHATRKVKETIIERRAKNGN